MVVRLKLFFILNTQPYSTHLAAVAIFKCFFFYVYRKFHSSGHGLGAISLVSPNETTTKRLVQQYEKLKAEGVTEAEIIEKSATAVGSERQLEFNKAKVATSSPDSVTAKLLNEADITNIFKDK